MAELPATTAFAEQGPLAYRCMLEEIFVKRSVKPDGNKIIKVKKGVGHKINCTGVIWTGPSGGRWAECDPKHGEVGWILVSGPGFGLKGPALIDATDDSMLVVEVFLLGGMEKELQGVIWQSVVPKARSVGEVKEMMCRETGLNVASCVFSKEKPCMPGVPGSQQTRLPVDYMPELKDSRLLSDCDFKDGATATLLLVYVGDMPSYIHVVRKPVPDIKDAREARIDRILANEPRIE